MQLGCNTVLFGSADLASALTYIAWAGYAYVAALSDAIGEATAAIERANPEAFRYGDATLRGAVALGSERARASVIARSLHD